MKPLSKITILSICVLIIFVMGAGYGYFEGAHDTNALYESRFRQLKLRYERIVPGPQLSPDQLWEPDPRVKVNYI